MKNSTKIGLGIAGVFGLLVATQVIEKNNLEKSTEFCAVNGDGWMMGTNDNGKTFAFLNYLRVEKDENTGQLFENPDKEQDAWGEGKLSVIVGSAPTCVSDKKTLLQRDMPNNAVELPRQRNPVLDMTM